VLAAFANSRATALFQALRDAAGNQPAFQIIDTAGSASQTAPKPKLYALVAFLVVLLLSLRVAFIARSPAVR
jgi:capsular polysaccharide biosynthesis protein